jgi:hypothetical protein
LNRQRLIMDYDVFLSHNSKDKPIVEQIAHKLTKEYGLRCWLDKWNLVPGEPWQEALEEALDQCRTVAVFVGSDEISPWENEEMRSALETRTHNRERRVVPVLLPGSLDSTNIKLPRFLSRLTWVDFRNGLDNPNALYQLYCGIQGINPGAENVTEDTRVKGLSVKGRIRTYFSRIRKNRRFWMTAIGIMILVLAILGLSGNLFIDIPFFCGRKLSSSAGYINQTIKQRDEGRTACAFKSLENALALQPTLVEKSHIYYLYASVFLNKQQPLKALEYADLGLGLDAGYDYEFLLHASKGFSYCQLSQNADASREFNLFLDSEPERAGSLANKAKDILADMNSGKDMSDVCWVLGAELLP